jgi:hypothetical protein
VITIFKSISIMNSLTAYVPRVEPPLHIILAIMDCIPVLSGIGTMIGAVLNGFNWLQIMVGFLQFVTMWIFGIGWLWSVVWGFLIYAKGQETANQPWKTGGFGSKNESGLAEGINIPSGVGNLGTQANTTSTQSSFPSLAQK